MRNLNGVNGNSSIAERTFDTEFHFREREQVHHELQRSRAQLETELADARLLQRLSMELVHEDGTAGLYQKIMDAAVAIMRSQYASMQMLYPEPNSIGKLKLLASSGFSPEAQKYWEWVNHTTNSSCGAVLRAGGKRVIIPNFATCAFMQGTKELPLFLESGIFAAQSTPLYSRSGKLLGMISTHWDHIHQPSERDLSLLDILARQAADLIERNQTSEALKQSEERLRALTTATSDVLYRASADWKDVYQLDSRNFLADTGEPIKDWLQKYIHPTDHQHVTEAINEAVRTKSVFQLEHRVIKVNGTIGWTFTRAVPILDHEGKIIEWFGAASDVTNRKSLMTELEKRVEKRTKELQRSNEDLQQFAHVASHDLKEPVRKIKTFGFRLRDELIKTPNEQAKIFVEKILGAAERMSLMIEGVLTYSTCSALERKIESIDLNKVLSEIQNDLEVVIQQKGAIIRHDTLPNIAGIQVLIYQLFYNLINNSLKFAKRDQTPVITIKTNVLTSEETTYTQIEIADNGIGFEPEFNEKIFESFTRLNPQHVFDGTGLGLSLCRKIVERHYGTIHANGQKDVGAAFTITLPLRQNSYA